MKFSCLLQTGSHQFFLSEGKQNPPKYQIQEEQSCFAPLSDSHIQFTGKSHPFWLHNLFWLVALLSSLPIPPLFKPHRFLDYCHHLLTAFSSDFPINSLLENAFRKNVIYIMLVIFLKSNNSFPLDFENNPNYLTWPSDPGPAFVRLHVWQLPLSFSLCRSHGPQCQPLEPARPHPARGLVLAFIPFTRNRLLGLALFPSHLWR